VKLRPGGDGERRLEGRLVSADDESITLETADGRRTEVRLESVERARTVFDWDRPNQRRNGARAANPVAPKEGSVA